MFGIQRSITKATTIYFDTFNQNIVWGSLTKFGTKIDSYKMDVYATKLKHIQIKETDLQIKSSRKQASRF